MNEEIAEKNKFLSAIGNGVKWLYEKGKAGLKKAKDYLVVKIPILKNAIVYFFSLLRRLLKGCLYGFYYGLKDGYHSYKQMRGSETPIDYYFLTTIEFDDVE